MEERVVKNGDATSTQGRGRVRVDSAASVSLTPISLTSLIRNRERRFIALCGNGLVGPSAIASPRVLLIKTTYIKEDGAVKGKSLSVRNAVRCGAV